MCILERDVSFSADMTLTSLMERSHGNIALVRTDSAVGTPLVLVHRSCNKTSRRGNKMWISVGKKLSFKRYTKITAKY